MTTENLYQFYKDKCQEFSASILFAKEKITYAQAFDLAMRRATFLQEQGYKKGEVIALLCQNNADWFISYMAITAVGCKALLFDTNLTQELYAQMLKTVQAKAIFMSSLFEFKFSDIKMIDTSLEQALALENKYAPVELAAEDISSLFFTSGTTGNSKVVGLTHGNIFKTAIGVLKHIEIDTRGMRFFAILPIYHVYGLAAGMLCPFCGGAQIVFQTSYKARDILDDLVNYKINVFPAVPKIWESFCDRMIDKVKDESKAKYLVFMFFLEHGIALRNLGLGKLVDTIFKPIHQAFGGNIELLISGGARLSKRHDLFYKTMGFKMLQGYGLTETVGPITVNKPSELKPICVGKPTQGNFVEIRNMNEDDIGEIWLKGDSVFPGYYNNPEANKEVFDNKGWFNSGDLGFVDSDGDLHIRGRRKNVIVLDSGKNVYPEEIEGYYQRSGLIAELAVFGRKIKGRDVVYAVIVPKERTSETYKQIKAELKHLNQGLPTYKMVTQFALSYDALPKTTTQKVKVFEIISNLDKGFYQTSERDQDFVGSELKGNTPEEIEIISIFKNQLKTAVMFGNQLLEEFEVDSLDYIELITTLEKTLNVSIDIETFIHAKNVKDLVNYLIDLKKHKDEVNFTDFVKNNLPDIRLPQFYNPLVEIIFWAIRVVSKLLWHVNVVNLDKYVVSNNIIVANHASYLDSIWLYSYLPYKYRKDVYFAVRKESSWLRFVMPGINFIFVNRSTSQFISILKEEADVLRDGKSIIIFPEATRSRDGKLGVFRTGAAFLAHALSKEIMPITISGTFDILPPHKKIPRLFVKRPVEIFVHDKIHPDKFTSYEVINQEMYKLISKEFKQ